MQYQITDNGASLKIVAGAIHQLVMKQAVKKISVIGSDIIKIDTGSVLTNIYINFNEVTVPVTASAEVLAQSLNTAINS